MSKQQLTMHPPRAKRRSDEVSLLTVDDHVSVDSREPSNLAFFKKKPQQGPPPVPSHTSSVTWKSNAVKEKEEYERIKQRVRHFAPEQFRANARPWARGPSEIFPQTAAEWVNHKKELLALAEAEKQNNCELLKAQIAAREKIPKARRKVKSAFGGGDGRIFADGLSPVLALPTIWSAEYPEPPAHWPTAAELQWNGDSRQCALAKTKCGRYLPPPRAQAEGSTPFQQQPFMRPLPLDQTGPIFVAGPRPDEVQVNNAHMDEDRGFEDLGSFYLGSQLMHEVGERGPPTFVPDRQPTHFGLDEEMYFVEEDMGAGLGDADMWGMRSEMFIDDRVPDQRGNIYEVWF